MNFLNVKPASITLVKPEIQHFLDSTFLRKNSKNLDMIPENWLWK